MAFVSRNPNNILNPETADGCVLLNPEKMANGQEFIGFYKNMYVEPTYDNKCYVFKGRDDGKDYLIFGCTSMHTEMAHYSIGDLVSITYEGEWVNKKGKYAGKSSHIWKVMGETDWIPTPEFINQLQQEVYNRRLEVQRQLGTPQGQNFHNQRPMQGQSQFVNAGPVQVTAVHPNQWSQNQTQTTGYFQNNGMPAVQTAQVNIPQSQNPFLNPYGTKPTDPFG